MKEKETHKFALSLTSQQKANLKSMAHHLKPVVQIGHQGLTDSVVAELKNALHKHELIKVQLAGNTDSSEKKSEEQLLVSQLPQHSHLVDRIGRVIILYFEQNPNEAKITLKSLK